MTTPKTDKEVMESLADAALEKEAFEKGQGFLERPYDRYRYHNGFIDGYQSALRHSPVVKQMYEALKIYRNMGTNETVAFLALQAYEREIGEVEK